MGMGCKAMNDKAMWAKRVQKWEEWKRACFGNMAACHNCGVVSLGGPGPSWKLVPGDPSECVSAVANPFLTSFCGPLDGDGAVAMHQCNSCSSVMTEHKGRVVHHQVYMSTAYRRGLMAVDYLDLQMLGCLDARLNLWLGQALVWPSPQSLATVRWKTTDGGRPQRVRERVMRKRLRTSQLLRPATT